MFKLIAIVMVCNALTCCGTSNNSDTVSPTPTPTRISPNEQDCNLPVRHTHEQMHKQGIIHIHIKG